MALRLQDGESHAIQDSAYGLAGYRPSKNLDANRPLYFMYFDVFSAAWTRGALPNAALQIEFSSASSGHLLVEYDSSDPDFRGPGEPGVWRRTEEIGWFPAPGIQSASISLPFSFFDNRCNGADIRISFIGTAPVVHRVRLQSAGTEKIRWQRFERSESGQTPVFAGASVRDFGAKGDGVTPDDGAFANGLLAVSAAGGGVLFVPPGRYLLTKPLVFPMGTGIQGVWRREWSRTNNGTVLVLDPELGYPGNPADALPPSIQIGESGSLRDMTLWYPKLRPDSPRAFPWMIANTGGNHFTLENLTLVNAWKGIRIGPSNNGLHTIRNVDMTALHTGLELDHTTDIGRLEHVTISPEIWTASTMQESPSVTGPHEKFIRENGTGIVFFRSDWEYTSFLTVRGYKTGLVAKPGPNGMGNAQWYALKFDDVETGMVVENVLPEGFIVGHGSITARQTAVRTGPDFSGTINFWETTVSAPTALDLSGVPQATVQIRGGRWDGEIRQGRPSLSLVGVAAPKLIRTPLSGLYLSETNPSNPVPPSRRPSSEWEKNPAASGRGFYVFTPPLGDATASLQASLNRMAATGGTVFLPPGLYKITSPLTVPGGVELRGAMDWPRHHFVLGSVLVIDSAPSDESGEAAVSLLPGSGIRGITFRYPRLDPRRTASFPPSIRVKGQNAWIRDINAVHAWWLIDASSIKSDYLWIDGVQGVPLRYGVTLGGGSTGQVVRNVHFNPHYAVLPRLPEVRPDGRDVDYWSRMVSQLEPFVLIDTRNAFLFHNFVFGSKTGLALRPDASGRGASALVIGQGTDGSPVAVTSEGTAQEGVDLINSQLVSMTARSTAYIVVSGQGQLRFWNTTLWGQPRRGLLVRNGQLSMYLSQFAAHAPFETLDGTTILDQIHLSFSSENPIPRKVGEGRLLLRNALLPVPFAASGGFESDNTFAETQSMDVAASSISVSFAHDGTTIRAGLALREKDGESELSPSNKDGRWGWAAVRPLPGARRDYYAYILVENPGFRQSNSGPLELRLTLWSPGSGRVRIVYDSNDSRVRVDPSAPGAWKEAGTLSLEGARGWRDFRFNINDARFDGRCNGADIRLEIAGVNEPVILGALVLDRRTPGR